MPHICTIVANFVAITELGCKFSYFKENSIIYQFPLPFAMSTEQFSGVYLKHVLYTICNSPASIIWLTLTRRWSQLQANFDLKLVIRDLSPFLMKERVLTMSSKGAQRPHCRAELPDVCCLQFVFVCWWYLPCWWSTDPVSFTRGTARGIFHVLSIMLNIFRPISQYATEKW